MEAQGGTFPATRFSVIAAAKSSDPAERSRAMNALISAYWKPVYKYVRLRWGLDADEAQDFTQDFFTRLIEKEFLDSYDPAKGHLRTFLRTCVDRLFLNQSRDALRQKRGSGAVHVSLDFEEAERELGQCVRSGSLEDYFDKEWVRSLFALAVMRLRSRCEEAGKMLHFELFERYDLDDSDAKISYVQLAAEFHLAVTDVTNYLAFARREFRRSVLDQLHEMTGNEEEFHREAQALLGVSAKSK
ncbi:MAG TPA: sigma-70 family RNA polymerase sigma factor [Terriglobales bacterium]|jgi:RNA polymerase sigma factor (sigma-70 family)|nr:sigma-70 family RNA polymerase sigma factor [Terriglobales bacterium]